MDERKKLLKNKVDKEQKALILEAVQKEKKRLARDKKIKWHREYMKQKEETLERH